MKKNNIQHFSRFNYTQCEVCGENVNVSFTNIINKAQCCNNCSSLLKKEADKNERNASTVIQNSSKWRNGN